MAPLTCPHGLAAMNSTAKSLISWPGPNVPNYRSTYDILWSCLVTIFACTYTVLHLNIPAQKDRKWKRMRRQAKYVLLNILAPEIVVGFACSEFLLTTRSTTDFRDSSGFSEEQWTLTHSFYAYAGGFLIQTSSGEALPAFPHELIMLGVNMKTIALPTITRQEIEERSKSDWLGKAFACSQLLCFAVNIVTRAIQHITVTPLEVTTAAYISCALLTYAFWWYKPSDIQSPTIVDGSAIPQEVFDKLRARSDIANRLEKQRIILSRTVETSLHHPKFFGTVLSVAVCTFNAVNFAAWSHQFPTYFEVMAWRVSTVVATGLSVFCVLVGTASNECLEQCEDFTFAASILLYALARSAIIAICFSTLRALPVDAYDTLSWV